MGPTSNVSLSEVPDDDLTEAYTGRIFVVVLDCFEQEDRRLTPEVCKVPIPKPIQHGPWVIPCQINTKILVTPSDFYEIWCGENIG